MTDASHVFHKWGAGVGADLPRVERAEGSHLVTADGERLVDAAAGAAVANLGHDPEGLDAVMAEQASEVGYLSLSHFAHDAPDRLAALLADRTPGDLAASFFVTSGSEAVETAIKLARAHHVAEGRPERSLVVSRRQSYHGATLGALSATGHAGRRRGFEPLLADWPTLPPAYPYRWDYDGTPEAQARAAAGELEATIQAAGPERVAAFVAEPVSGASIPAAHPHPAYFEEIRRICDAHGVLFVADEVMTGFGRTGPLFACERFDVVPDLLAVGKGLSAGYAPIAATVVREPIADTFAASDGGESRPGFQHGHTYGGHPVAAAVAAEAVSRYTEDLLATARERGRQLDAGLAPLRGHPMVGDLRRAGLLLGVEFVAERETDAPFDPDRDVRGRVYRAALDRGVYTYPGGGSVDGEAGDHLLLAPPLTVDASTVDEIARVVVEAVETVADDLGVS